MAFISSLSVKLLRPATLVVACLAGGAAWSDDIVVVVNPPPVSDPAVSARQQQMTLQLARANLSQQGIAEPTTAELALAASDVQALRDSGMGWGQVAHSLGLRLGSVVSAANRADKAERVADASQAKSRTPSKADERGQGPGSNGRGGSQSAGGGQGSGGKGGGGSNAGGGGNAGGSGGVRAAAMEVAMEAERVGGVVEEMVAAMVAGKAVAMAAANADRASRGGAF
ncbi:MAG: hypothetical protein R3E42_01170 [Burkholderiaceae bacterium]